MGYIICLFALILVSVICILLMPKFRNTKLTNACFLAISFVCYVASLIRIYSDVGFFDWNFQNALPYSNVSPFMFASLLVYLFLPQKAKRYWALLIVLLVPGMFLSAALGCISRAAIHYKFHFHFLFDYVAHISLFLFGIYQVRSKQWAPTKKDCLWSGGMIVGVALLMLIVNLIFGTAFFGLALNEQYNIYNMKIVPNCYLSALLYFLGLCAVLVAGYFLTLAFRPREKE